MFHKAAVQDAANIRGKHVQTNRKASPDRYNLRRVAMKKYKTFEIIANGTPNGSEHTACITWF